MYLKQIIQKFIEERKRVIAQLTVYLELQERLRKDFHLQDDIEIADINSTIEFFDQKQILLSQVIAEMNTITQI